LRGVQEYAGSVDERLANIIDLIVPQERLGRNLQKRLVEFIGNWEFRPGIPGTGHAMNWEVRHVHFDATPAHVIRYRGSPLVWTRPRRDHAGELYKETGGKAAIHALR